MSAPNRIDLDEQLRQDAIICKNGVDTDFWDLVKKMLGRVSDEAKSELVFCPPTDVTMIAERQAICRVVQQLITTVEGTAKLI